MLSPSRLKTDQIKTKIKNSHYYKFTGVAPEGFVMIPEEVLEKLKTPEIWKTWVDNDEFLNEMIIDYCNKI